MTNANQPQSPFAQTPEEALERFNEYKSKDPFPDILPALLNSADIYDYVAVTAMIHPFDPEKLKSASYAVPILGKVVYWDENNEKQVEIINKGDEFILRQNSIAFVTIEPMLRLPDYIAFRFNLKITNVYRGILLGTGPLVDPGFDGKLSIPLHNLTTNDYKFVGGEDLIWMEFTKLSPNQRWHTSNTNSSPIPRTGQYKPFPPGKALPDVEGYLRKADPHRSIRSSIPDAVSNASKSAEKAAKTAETIRNIATIGILTLFFSLIGFFFQVNNLVQNTYTNIDRSYQHLRILEDNIDKQRLNFLIEEPEKIKTIQNQLQDIQESINKLEKLTFKK